MRFLYFALIFCFICGGSIDAKDRKTSQDEWSERSSKGDRTFAILDPFVISLKGGRYAKIQIALEFNSVEFTYYMRRKLFATMSVGKLSWLDLVKDTIVCVISSKSFKEISTPKGRDKLKEEMLQEINSYMVDGYVEDIVFSEFVIR